MYMYIYMTLNTRMYTCTYVCLVWQITLGHVIMYIMFICWHQQRHRQGTGEPGHSFGWCCQCCSIWAAAGTADGSWETGLVLSVLNEWLTQCLNDWSRSNNVSTYREAWSTTINWMANSQTTMVDQWLVNSWWSKDQWSINHPFIKNNNGWSMVKWMDCSSLSKWVVNGWLMLWSGWWLVG